MITAPGRSWKTRAWVALPVVAIAVIVTMIIVRGGITGSDYSWAGCGEGPTDPSITAEKYAGDYLHPYGNVSSCRELDRRSHLFRPSDLSVYLLLTTQKGLAADIHARGGIRRDAWVLRYGDG